MQAEPCSSRHGTNRRRHQQAAPRVNPGQSSHAAASSACGHIYLGHTAALDRIDFEGRRRAGGPASISIRVLPRAFPASSASPSPIDRTGPFLTRMHTYIHPNIPNQTTGQQQQRAAMTAIGDKNEASEAVVNWWMMMFLSVLAFCMIMNHYIGHKFHVRTAPWVVGVMGRSVGWVGESGRSVPPD